MENSTTTNESVGTSVNEGTMPMGGACRMDGTGDCCGGHGGKKTSGGSERGWKLVSVILALALITVVLRPIIQEKQVTPTQAGNAFLEMVNKVYTPTVSNATMTSVTKVHGMYFLQFNADINGETMPQEVYLSTDGALFMPQTLSIADILTQYEAAQQEAAQAPVDDSATDSTGGTAADGSTNPAGTVEEGTDTSGLTNEEASAQ